MRRRDFITLLGGTAAAWPLAVSAQQMQMRRVAVLTYFNANDPAGQVFLTAFKRRLTELSWTDGQNVTMIYKFTDGSPENVRVAAGELVETAPDVIFAASNVSVGPLLQATKTIPIIFTQVSDPVGSGFVASLARPGGNLTGFQGYEPGIGGKWLELLREIAPGVRRVAVIHNPNISANVAILRAAENAAISLDVAVTAAGAGDAADIERILTRFAQQSNSGVIVTPSPLTNTKDKRELMIALADRLSLPAIYPSRLSATSGELISYVYDAVTQWQGAATYVDRVLRGAKPSELPVQAPTKYEMIINLKTAKALGLTIPESFLLRADKVIE